MSHLQPRCSRPLEAGSRAIELAPDSPLALNNYALALNEAQRWDEAVQLTQTACQRAPDDPTTLLALVQRLPANAVGFDLGCGSGELARHLASLGHQVTGCDISTQMLERAAAAVDE